MIFLFNKRNFLLLVFRPAMENYAFLCLFDIDAISSTTYASANIYLLDAIYNRKVVAYLYININTEAATHYHCHRQQAATTQIKLKILHWRTNINLVLLISFWPRVSVILIWFCQKILKIYYQINCANGLLSIGLAQYTIILIIDEVHLKLIFEKYPFNIRLQRFQMN